MQTITDADRLNTLAENVIHREREVFGYQINIDNYTAMLESLPKGEWPSEIAQYKTTLIEKLPETMDFEMVQAISDYQYRDRIAALLRTERIEQNKANRVYQALLNQIPADQKDQLIAQAKLRISAQ